MICCCDNQKVYYNQQLAILAASIHLQWFAEEDEGRSEEPSEQKIRRAREEGRVAKSLDFSSALSLLLLSCSLLLLGPWIYRRFLNLLRLWWQQDGLLPATNNSWLLLRYLLLTILPVLGVSVIAAISGGLLQHGWLFSSKPVQFRFDRIRPQLGQWLKRSFSWPDGVYAFSKNILRLLLIALITFLLILNRYQRLYRASFRTVAHAVNELAAAIIILLFGCALSMLLLSLSDLLFQRFRHRQSLKMSKQEVKEEQKQTDGDPVIRSHLRRRMREMLQSNLPSLVQQATVIITNPTQIAVVIKWDAATMTAPTVTSKGEEQVAHRIRQLAKLYRVPLMENKPLARSLYYNVKVGQMVPSEYWQLLSRILAEVYRLQKRSFD